MAISQRCDHLSIVTQAKVLHIHNVGIYHQITKVARRYIVGSLRSLNFRLSKPDVREVLKRGIEMMKQKLSLHCNMSLEPFKGYIAT